MAKLATFHLESALATKRGIVTYKILYNFCFGEILCSVQILSKFYKSQKGGIRVCYSDPIWITGSLSSAAAARAAPRACVRARSCLLPGSPGNVDAPGLLSPPFERSVDDAVRFLRPESFSPDEPFSPKFTITSPSRAKLSNPESSSPSCEPSAPPNSLSNP